MIETRSPLNGPGASALMGKAVHGMGSYQLGRSTRPGMPSANEGARPALFQVEPLPTSRGVGFLRAGARCPGLIEELTT